jgi:hypothetical protein
MRLRNGSLLCGRYAVISDDSKGISAMRLALCWSVWKMRMLEQIVFAAFGHEAGIVTVMGTLADFLLPAAFGIAQLWLGHGVQKTFVLITRLLAADAERNTGNHPCTS